MTYAELVTQIESYTENSYPTVDVNTFITQAENRIFNSVNLPDLRRNDTGTISLGNKYLNVPDDWLATYSLAVIDNTTNEYTFLLNKDVNFIRESFPDTDVAHYGKPKYYAVFDDETFILGPTPDTGYGAELHYFFILSLLLLPLVVSLGWVIITLPLYFMVHCWKRILT